MDDEDKSVLLLFLMFVIICSVLYYVWAFNQCYPEISSNVWMCIKLISE